MNNKTWYRQLHWQIIIGLVLGLIYGIIAAGMGWQSFTSNWISPFGTIFMNLLKLIAVPLVVASLITGVASLSDMKKISRIGGKTITIYILTTLIALCIGLTLVNVLKPGANISPTIQEKMQYNYEQVAKSKLNNREKIKGRGPLQPVVDMVPSNIVSSFGNNRNMLQVVFFAILFGIALTMIPRERAKPIQDFFQGLNDTVIQVVNLIMKVAPYGVFALLAKTITTIAGDDLSQVTELLGALGYYCFVVILGLVLHASITYPLMIKAFSPMKIKTFFKGIAPAQLLAFSTSSSGATLPVTMERCEKHLGVSEEVSAFALPLGATINMDGTALYQAVAAVFISQVIGIDLSMGDQMTIIFTALLASIGTAAVPGAGIIMLIVILESVGIPAEGIALILGVDRILDMMRTTANVTGDAAVTVVVAASENALHPPTETTS